mmetsp:Transcript_113445/g.321048  ORF Transcript_113445/g.321048 Transcript_113445/m.321048 type:complete len:205 (-) Transcript_113445:343-957(-)
MHLEELQGLLDELAHAEAFPLAVVDAIADVDLLIFEDVEHRQDLPVVWHQGLADHLTAENQGLQDLEHGRHELAVACVQRRLDRDDELWDDRQNLGAALLQHVVSALDRDEPVRVLLFSEPVKEYRQVVVVIEFFDVNLPRELETATVENRHGEIASIIELAELRGHYFSSPCGARARRRRRDCRTLRPAVLRDAERGLLVEGR